MDDATGSRSARSGDRSLSSRSSSSGHLDYSLLNRTRDLYPPSAFAKERKMHRLVRSYKRSVYRELSDQRFAKPLLEPQQPFNDPVPEEFEKQWGKIEFNLEKAQGLRVGKAQVPCSKIGTYPDVMPSYLEDPLRGLEFPGAKHFDTEEDRKVHLPMIQASILTRQKLSWAFGRQQKHVDHPWPPEPPPKPPRDSESEYETDEDDTPVVSPTRSKSQSAIRSST